MANTEEATKIIQRWFTRALATVICSFGIAISLCLEVAMISMFWTRHRCSMQSLRGARCLNIPFSGTSTISRTYTPHASHLTPHALCQVPSRRRYLSAMDLFFRSSIESNDNDGKELHQCPSCEKKRHRARIWRAAIEMEYFEQAQPYFKLECHEQNFTCLRNLTQHGKSCNRNTDCAFVHALNQFFR